MADSTAVPGGAARRLTQGRPSSARLLARQFRAQNKLFWRNPFSAFFTMLFPLMFLLLFCALNGNQTIDSRSGIRFAQFFTPSVIVFAAVSACYTQMATAVPINRDEGILKRYRGTPLPGAVYVAARLASSIWMSLLASVLMVVVGVALFHVQIVWRLLPAAVVTLLVGAASFCAIGLAVASLVPNGESAPAIANFTWLPVAFVSDIFYPMDSAPQWLKTVGGVFPVKHFANAMQDDFNPFTKGPGLFWAHLAVIAAWALAGTVVAVRNFKWEPQVETGGGVRRRRRSG